MYNDCNVQKCKMVIFVNEEKNIEGELGVAGFGFKHRYFSKRTKKYIMIYNNSPPFLQYEKHCHCLCSIAVYLYVLYIKTHDLYNECILWCIYMYHGFL